MLERSQRRATRADRDRLNLTAGAPVLSVVCRHDAAGRPFCHEDRLISLAAVPEAGDELFEAISPGPWLIAKSPWTSAEHRIRAVAADREIAASLRIAEAAPCLVVERRTWMREQPVTHVTLTYPAGAHELVASFTPSQS